MSSGKLIKQKKFLLAGILYFVVCGLLLYRFGIQTGGEAEKYIDNANRILEGRELRNGFFGFFYVVYSLLVTFFVGLKINLVFVAVVQVFLSFLAAVCMYRLLILILGKENLGFVFFVIYLICYPIQKWNFYLYSDGIHTSLVVIGLYFLYRLLNYTKLADLIGFSVLFLLILFSRPTGLIFAFAAFFVLLAWLRRNRKTTFIFGLLALAVIVTIGLIMSPITAFVNPDSIRRMEVICQVPQTNQNAIYREFNQSGLSEVYEVIFNEIGIGSFIKTGGKKLLYFFGMYRNYYSWPNNMLLLSFTVFYPLMLLGIYFKSGKHFFDSWLMAVLYILITAIAIFFTCDDWANRFVSPVFPFVLILAAGGLRYVSNIFNLKGELTS